MNENDRKAPRGLNFLLRDRNVFLGLVKKNIKSQYAGSLLGMLWAFINPVLLACIVSFVFTSILKVQTPNFYLYIISGMLPWGFFSASLQEASMAIPRHAAFLKQFPLEKVFLPASVVGAQFVFLLAAFGILLPLFLCVNPSALPALPWLLLALALFLIFTLGASLITAVLCIEWHDMRQALNVILTYWMWLTPVFYAVDMVPREYRILMELNPVYLYLGLFRSVLFEGRAPALTAALLLTGVSFGVLAAGIVLFLKKENGFLKKI